MFDKPYLYYATMLFLGRNCDLVHIEYACEKDNAVFGELSMLTPILTSPQLADHLLETKQPIFHAIGTKDRFYQEELIDQLRQTKPNLHLALAPNANHALEIGWDVHASIATLETIMKE